VPDVAKDTQGALIVTCTMCGHLLPVTDFYADRRSAAGRRKDCKRCCVARDRRRMQDPEKRRSYLAYQAAYREAHRAKARATTAAYRAANPERVRQAMEQWRAQPANQRLARERARAFRIANPARRREYERRRRAIVKASVIGFITPEQLTAKLAYWGDRCWMCGSTDRITIDHVKPLSKGGAHVLCNLRPACRSCNTRKNDAWPFPVAGLTCSASPSKAKTTSARSPKR